MVTSEIRPLPRIFMMLPLLALSIDLLTPFLISKGALPAEIRWLSHLTIATMIVLSIVHALSTNHIPVALWLVLTVTLIWSYIAVGHEQAVGATLWGVWLLFQFPLIAVFAYLQGKLPARIATNIPKYALFILSAEVLVQMVQFGMGEKPGDNLAGLFGKNGTGIALVFATLVNCLFLGYWIVSRRWLGFLASLSLGLISSALGEMKMFPLAIVIVGLAAAIIYAKKYRSPHSLLITFTLIVGAAWGFVFLYNSIVPDASQVPIQSYLENPARLSHYLNSSRTYYNRDGSRTSDFGRMYALEVGWNSISIDPVTLLFGYGLGSRSESRTWGATGVALASGNYGWSVGTSLLILMQETGLVGLTVLGCLITWIIFTLTRQIRTIPASSVNGLRYALILFSLLVPLMLWYANVWAMRVPMLIYWYLVGYVLADSRTTNRSSDKYMVSDPGLGA